MPTFDTPPRRIAILRLSALGDCILLIPTIRRIQAHWPDTEITWIIDENFLSLLKTVSGVNFWPIKKPNSWSDYKSLKSRFTSHHFDVLLAMQASFRANLLYPLIKSRIKLGFDQKRSRDLHWLFINHKITPGEDHLLDSFQRFADALGIPKSPVRWDMALPEIDLDWAKEQLHLSGSSAHPRQRWIAINPAASKLERTAYPEFYIALINEIQSINPTSIVLTGGPASWEKELAKQISEGCQRKPLNLVGNTSLTQIAAILKFVDLLIAPDTGPAHIANAFNTPVIGLYAVAPPQLSGPYLSQKLVINKFPQAVREILGENPDRVKWGTRVHDRKAMTLFSVEEVIAKIPAACTLASIEP